MAIKVQNRELESKLSRSIKTACWFTPLPVDHVRIGISRGVPRGMQKGYFRYPKLYPGPWFNSCSSAKEFRDRYYQEVLCQLDASEVVAELFDRARSRVPVLVCFEGQRVVDGWCHRAIVSEWLFCELGLEVTEYGLENLGFGTLHPKSA